MITITPNSTIHLVKCPLEQDYQHQFLWNSKQAQDEYFAKETRWSFDNYTYLKKDNVVKVSQNIDSIIDCSYLYYQNVGFTTKTYYCFITGMDYVNENCTAIHFETDVFQTWQFDGNGNSLINYNKCFVEREHVLDDDIGSNTIPEGLETGEYKMFPYTTFDDGAYYIFVQASNRVKNKYTQSLWWRTTNVGKIYQQGTIYVCDQEDFNILIDIYNNDGQIDSIYNAYIVPSQFFDHDLLTDVTFTQTSTGTTYKIPLYMGSGNEQYYKGSVNLPSNLDGYTPYNKKLFTYPYSYILISNNQGSSNVYHYENFDSETPTTFYFRISGIASVGASSFIAPVNYYKEGVERLVEEGLMGAKYPTLNWNSDNYINWLTQNAVNMSVGVGTQVLNTAISGLKGQPMDVSGVASTITNDMLAIYQQKSFNPNSVRGNTNGGDVIYSMNRMGFTAYRCCPRYEICKSIDRYWSMYGYRVNLLKVPELTSRKLWNYVKTQGCNFDANIPQEDLNRIRQMFNDGVTLWHTTDMFNYDLDNNTIVTSNEERKESD